MNVRCKRNTTKYCALALLLVIVLVYSGRKMVKSDFKQERHAKLNKGPQIQWSANMLTDDEKDDYANEEYSKDIEVKIIKDIEVDTKRNKFILIWIPFTTDIFGNFSIEGKEYFKKRKCLINNCFLTDNRTYFGKYVENFDAIIFNGKAYSVKNDINVFDIPERRSPNQRYIFYEMRSATEYPICIDSLENFFNWTMTYRLDSDIPSPMIVIKNKTGHIVGPKNHMRWMHDTLNWETDYITNTLIKTKGVIYFEKRCTNVNDTDYNIIHNLRASLEKYGLDFDIVGKCRVKYCKEFDCDVLKEDVYHFYLLLDDSNRKDYVTEDLMKYMALGLVPVVLGRTNLSSFLPPDAYINGDDLSSDEIAAAIFKAMMDSNIFQGYFRWKKHYIYEKADRTKDVCTLCAALNDQKLLKQQKIYKDIRDWWSQDYLDTCDEGSGAMELEYPMKESLD